MGQTVYADDIQLPRMLVGKLLRSPQRHAKIVSVGQPGGGAARRAWCPDRV